MQLVKIVWPTKFLYVKRLLPRTDLRILDIGCGNNSPSITKHWFPGCHYSGADIQHYNNSDDDLDAMDAFYPLGVDGSGYALIPDRNFDYILLHHVVEHMPDPYPILAQICKKLRPGGYLWVAFPSVATLTFPHAATGTLHFCDDQSHVFVPEIPSICNVLLKNQVIVVHAGRTRDAARTIVGLAALPWALLKKLFTGKLAARGLWYVLGFEDHVLGQYKPDLHHICADNPITSVDC